MICKCKECTERYVGCHSSCEHYKKYREYLAEKKAIKDKKKKADDLWYAFKRKK